MRIGWYVHHHGAGHLTRARVVGEELLARGHDVALLGSRLGDAGAPFVRVELPMDDEGVDLHRDEVTAGGRLHWTPLRHTGLRDRGTMIAGWVGEWRPDVLVADVSVEVALLARLLGVPVVVVGQPGERDDEPHRTVYDIASAVLAPWPEGWARQLAPHLEGCPRLVEVGGISRMASGPASTGGTSQGGGVVLAGGTGFDDAGLVDRIVTAAPSLSWEVLDGRTWVEDVTSVLAGADVVVTHAGQNAVADIAALDRPAVVLPQSRPYREQERLAVGLAAGGLARVVWREAQSDPATGWIDEIEAALADGTRWQWWGTEGAAGRAADVVEGVGRG